MARTRKRVALNRGADKESRVHPRTAELSSLIEEALEHKAQIDTANAELKEVSDLIQDIMKTNGSMEATSETGIAKMVTPRSNSKTVIDPEQFRDEVKDDEDFYGAISVGVTAARKILPQRTIDRISETTTGKPKEPVVKIDWKK